MGENWKGDKGEEEERNIFRGESIFWKNSTSLE